MSGVGLRAMVALALMLAAVPPAAAQRPPVGGPAPIPSSGGPQGQSAGHGHVGSGRAHAAVYDIVTVGAVIDPAAVKAVAGRLGPSLAGTSGRLLVDADGPIATVGTGPSYMAVIVFDDVWSRQAWQRSDAAVSILADLGTVGAVAVVSAGGIADPGAPPSVPAEALGPGKLLRIPVIPTIGDICKGC